MATTKQDTTALATISLLEARLLRIEHLLFGSLTPAKPQTTSAIDSMASLERRFQNLIGNFKVYADLLRFYNRYPSLFQTPNPSKPPTQLDTEAIRAEVLACAASFPSTASALMSILTDTPVPDPALSTAMISLMPRMERIEETQRAQSAEIAELRGRSERAVRQWYESRMLGYSKFVANVEGRTENVERHLRRMEKVRELDAVV